MKKVEWSEEFAIGINVIDSQHHRIIDYINELIDIKEKGEDDKVAYILESLVDYTISHFAFEEALMEEAEYDSLSVHKTTHVAFADRINGLQKRNNEGANVSEELASLLQTWLINHIMSDDQSYAPLVKQKYNVIENKNGGSWISNTVKRFFG